MNPFEMVIGIILIVTIGSIVRAKLGVHRHQRGENPADAAENRRLHEEVRALKDRVQVLERVITDNESGLRLDHEIERLRDKNSV